MTLFANPSLITRITIGKGMGLAFGLLAFFLAPAAGLGGREGVAGDVAERLRAEMDPNAGLVRWGLLLWYPTLGAMIGVFGVFTWHPVLRLPMPWWFRAPLLGGWMNFVLAFFAHERAETMLAPLLGRAGSGVAPWWLALDGAIIGLIIGAVATRLGGEGRGTVEADG